MNSISSSGPKHVPSKLLSSDENEILFKLLGNRCQTQCSAVVQVFITEGPTHSTWVKKHCGVVTFTKDSNRRSYFIQVFDIVRDQKLFEQELYNQFSYHVSMPFFHQFEGENHMVGLNFADNEEADSFNRTISDRQASKQRKKEERRRQQQLELNHHQQQLHQQQNQQRSLQPINSQPNLSVSSQSLNKTKIKKGGRRTNKLSKDQIGEPTNFQHITHVGFDQDKGITVNGEDEALHDFFKLAGVSDNLLQDDSTRKFIYDFIDQHGGVERAAEETKVYGSVKRTPSSSSTTKPALPSRNSISGGVVPPQPPPRPQQPLNFHPQTAPPPPPPPKDRGSMERAAAPQPPQLSISSSSSSLQSMPVSQTGIHPPPPPPPRGSVGVPPPPRMPLAMGANIPPPPPPPPSLSNAPAPVKTSIPPSLPENHNRNDLLAQIRQRPALNPVSQKKIEKPETDTRTNLMSEIRKREYELKPVTPIEGDVSPGFTTPAENTMAAMLARALEGRAKAIQNESDSEEEEEEDEDEWDDN